MTSNANLDIIVKHYELAFCVDPDMEDEEGNLVFKPHRRPDIYFNFAVDTMALTWHQTKRAGVVGSRGHSAVDVFVHKLDRRELDRVQHLAMDEDLFQYLWDRFFWRREDRHPSVYFEVFRAFFNLRTFTIVWVVGPREYFWHGEPKFDTTFIRLEENARPVGHAGHRDLCSLLRGIETTYSSSFHVWHRPELRYAVKSCVT